jgi:hypothetical protein
MSISYEWNVNTVDVYPTDEEQTNVIYNVHWRIKRYRYSGRCRGQSLHSKCLWNTKPRHLRPIRLYRL